MKPLTMTMERLLQFLERAEMAAKVTLPGDEFLELVRLAIAGHGPRPLASTARGQETKALCEADIEWLLEPLSVWARKAFRERFIERFGDYRPCAPDATDRVETVSVTRESFTGAWLAAAEAVSRAPGLSFHTEVLDRLFTKHEGGRK